MFYVFVFQLEETKLELEQLKAEHDKKKLSINSELSIRQHKQEKKTDKNQEKEQKFLRDKVDFRAQVKSHSHKYNYYKCNHKCNSNFSFSL